MRKEFEKTSRNPIKESSQTEAESTEDVKQGKEEEIERDEAFYRRKAAARIDAIAEKLHSLIIRSMPWIYWPTIVTVTLIVLLIILGVIVVRVWHLLLGPEYYLWLGDEELSDIDKILGAILGGGLLGSRLQKFFSEKSALK